MRCIKCGCEDSSVIDSRPTDDMSSIRRRRECSKCKYRFTTYERIEEKPIVVKKRSGSSEQFDRDKLFRGVIISCAKRPVEAKVIEQLIDDIISELRNNGILEINSDQIGEMVLRRLAKIDQVAYVRFASVYKEFSNIGEFEKVLSNLNNEQ